MKFELKYEGTQKLVLGGTSKQSSQSDLLNILFMGNPGVPSTSYCLTGLEFASSRAEPKGKANDGARRSQHVYLVKCECDYMPLF